MDKYFDYNEKNVVQEKLLYVKGFRPYPDPDLHRDGQGLNQNLLALAELT